MKKQKKYNLWPLKITVFTFFLSVSINVVTNLLIEKVSIVSIIAVKYHNGDEMFLNLVLSGIVAAVTVGGKAAGKNVAMTKSHDIIQGAGIALHFIKNIFTFGKAGGKKQKKKER